MKKKNIIAAEYLIFFIPVSLWVYVITTSIVGGWVTFYFTDSDITLGESSMSTMKINHLSGAFLLEIE